MKGQELTSLEKWILSPKGIVDKSILNVYMTALSLADILLSKPKLGDFIPCDLEGTPLEKKDYFYLMPNIGVEMKEDWSNKEYLAYQEAESRVLWEGEWKVIDVQGTKCVQNLKPFYTLNIDTTSTLTYSQLTDKGLIFKREL